MQFEPYQPLFAQTADTSDGAIYHAVGKFLTAWEWTEFSLSFLYSAFVGLRNGEAVQQYGGGRIFRDRHDILTRAAACHFVAHCSQDREGTFDRLCEKVLALASHRNDVAHGITLDVSTFAFFRTRLSLINDRPAFLLVPPFYLGRRHDTYGPSYAHSASTMDWLTLEAVKLQIEIDDLRKTI